MSFQFSDRSKDLQLRISKFMDDHIYPAEEIYAQQMEEFTQQGDRWQIPQIIEDKKEVAEVAPKIKVETYLTPRKDAPRELASGTIDFSIDPPVHSDPHLKHEKIYQEDYVMIVRKDHPILEKKDFSIDDYLKLSHIHISNRKTGLGHVDMTLYRLGFARDIALRAQHFLVAPYIVEQSDLAITTTKGFAVDRDLAWKELPFEIDPLVLHLYWHEANDSDPSSKWMKDLMLKTYGKLQKVI